MISCATIKLFSINYVQAILIIDENIMWRRMNWVGPKCIMPSESVHVCVSQLVCLDHYSETMSPIWMQTGLGSITWARHATSGLFEFFCIFLYGIKS